MGKHRQGNARNRGRWAAVLAYVRERVRTDPGVEVEVDVDLLLHESRAPRSAVVKLLKDAGAPAEMVLAARRGRRIPGGSALRATADELRSAGVSRRLVQRLVRAEAAALVGRVVKAVTVDLPPFVELLPHLAGRRVSTWLRRTAPGRAGRPSDGALARSAVLLYVLAVADPEGGILPEARRRFERIHPGGDLDEVARWSLSDWLAVLEATMRERLDWRRVGRLVVGRGMLRGGRPLLQHAVGRLFRELRPFHPNRPRERGDPRGAIYGGELLEDMARLLGAAPGRPWGRVTAGDVRNALERISRRDPALLRS